MSGAPILVWVRRDLRLADNALLTEAARSGRPVIPVFILDPETEALGAAPKWRLGKGVAAFAARLAAIGSRLILRRGPARDVLAALVAETRAGAVWWHRLYDPEAIARDTAVKAALAARGTEARSFAGHVLFEPWSVATGQGGFYRVYTPFWRAVVGREVASALPAVAELRPPTIWPTSESLTDWHLGAAMNRGAAVVAVHAAVGEAAAEARLARFLDGPVEDYARNRDLPAEPATSRLSENLSYGEISARRVWRAGLWARDTGAAGAETFLRELAWREFAYHLIYHYPHITHANWREGWDAFPWQGDGPEAERWRRGTTGEPFVDAAMRELYVTGTMHNRARMIAASYLTKHLITDWRVGLAWFAECLIDWDPAANAMGWQWVAGSGPDAAPYFRIFNPRTQAEKFDRDGHYRRRFLDPASAEARAFFDAAPRAWGLAPGISPLAGLPAPMITPEDGRARALAAWQALRG